MSRHLQIIAVVGLSLAVGCSHPETSNQPRVGLLNMGTNELRAVIPPGIHRQEVERRIGKPCRVMDRGLLSRTTNSTGVTTDIPMEVWVYACPNGSMWVIFETNNVVRSVEANPGMSL